MVSVKFIIDNITIQTGKMASVTLTVGSNNHTYTISLLALRYHKKIFQPGFVSAKIQLRELATTTTPAMPSAKEIINFFAGKAVSLTKGDTSIASDYYIYEVEPELRRDVTGMYARVSLYCYSRDHKLTLAPYCRTYVRQKLCGNANDGGILQDALNSGGVLNSAGFTSSTVTFSDLHFLMYLRDNTTKAEFIQPYLVQYNESFYDFIARTANRCGEFVYHEGGKWHVGLTTGTEKTINTTEVQSYRYRENSTPAITVKPAYTDGMDLERSKEDFKENDDAYYTSLGITDSTALKTYKKNQELEFPWKGMYAGGLNNSTDYFYCDELPIDEYLGIVLKKDGFATFGDELLHGWQFLFVDALNALLNQASMLQMAGQAIEKLALSLIMARISQASKNREGNEKWINDAPTEQTATIDGKQNVNQYGSMLDTTMQQQNYDYQQNLNAKFYQFVSKCSHAVGKMLIDVVMSADSTTYGLCDLVKLGSDSCVVIEVSEDLVTESEERSAAQQGQHLVLAKKYNTKVYAFDHTDSNTKEDHYTKSTDLSVYCPPAVVPFVRSVGTQRAIVADNNDPESYGRVCIRYPWQAHNDAASPWIRMAVPFAPSDVPDVENGRAGILFEPSEGDEVLVDYENGNIEHPIVVGVLFSRRTKAPKARNPLMSGEDIPEDETDAIDSTTKRLIPPIIQRRIASAKGHSVTFYDSDNVSDFVAGAYPGMRFVKQVGTLLFRKPVNFIPDDTFTGGITLSDKWGLYKIAASSTQRNITIQSPLGNVNINAFTGITIDAPNGDITIRGKNVSIEAGNKVNLVSGKNIANKEKSAGDLSLDFGVSLSMEAAEIFAPIADLSLLRAVVEAFFKPLAGTLGVQSCRYLLLTAGKGVTRMPAEGFRDGQSRGSGENDTYTKLYGTFRYIRVISNQWYNELEGLYKNVKVAKQALEGHANYGTLSAPKADDIIANRNNAVTDVNDFTDANLNFTADPGNDVKSALRNACNDLRHAMKALVNHCNDMKSSLLLPHDNPQIYFAELSAKIRAYTWDDLLNGITTYIEDYSKDDATLHNDIATAKKKMRRKLAVDINTDNTLVNLLSRDITKLNNLQRDYSDDTSWQEYIDDLNVTPSQHGFWSQVRADMKDYFPQWGGGLSQWGDWWNDAAFIKEKGIWSASNHGEILMSDKEGLDTFRLENGAIQPLANWVTPEQVKNQLLSTF